MKEYFAKNMLDYELVVVEQTEDKEFNRGKLLNVGFDIAKDRGDCFAFHDVDQLPVGVDYDLTYSPVHLAPRMQHNGYRLPYKETMGGVVLMTKRQFINIDGFRNDFWGWGWEDCDLYMRCTLFGYTVHRPTNGVFQSLDHDRKEVNTQGHYRDCVLENSAKFSAIVKENNFEYHGPFVHNEEISEPPSYSGLSTLQYEMLQESIGPDSLYIKYKVEI